MKRSSKIKNVLCGMVIAACLGNGFSANLDGDPFDEGNPTPGRFSQFLSLARAKIQDTVQDFSTNHPHISSLGTCAAITVGIATLTTFLLTPTTVITTAAIACGICNNISTLPECPSSLFNPLAIQNGTPNTDSYSWISAPDTGPTAICPAGAYNAGCNWWAPACDSSDAFTTLPECMPISLEIAILQDAVIAKKARIAEEKAWNQKVKKGSFFTFIGTGFLAYLCFDKAKHLTRDATTRNRSTGEVVSDVLNWETVPRYDESNGAIKLRRAIAPYCTAIGTVCFSVAGTALLIFVQHL